MIRGMNDSLEEVGRFYEWVRLDLDPETPVHFIMVHRFHRLKNHAEIKLESLEKSVFGTKCGLNNVYVGGTTERLEQNTYFPECGALLISRTGDANAEKVCFKNQQVSRFCPSHSKVRVLLRGRSCPCCARTIAIRDWSDLQ